MLERTVTSESEETVHSKVIQVSLPTLTTSFPGVGLEIGHMSTGLAGAVCDENIFFQDLRYSGVTMGGVLCAGLLHGGTAIASRTQPVPASGPALGVGCGAH